MSEWITDRLPTKQDADANEKVWITTEYGQVMQRWWDCVHHRPWMPIKRPEPYVKPEQRFTVIWYDNVQTWAVKDSQNDERGLPSNFQTKQAAERIAEVYNEVLS